MRDSKSLKLKGPIAGEVSTTAQPHAKESKNIGSIWNDRFREKSNLRNKELLEAFWSDVKKRLIERYATLWNACIKFSSDGDGSLQFFDFSELLKSLLIELKQDVGRSIFEVATHGERFLPYNQFKCVLVERTLGMLTKSMKTSHAQQERIKSHASNFLRYLVLHDAGVAATAAKRLQVKLSMSLCRSLCTCLMEALPKPPSAHLPVDRVCIRRAMCKAEFSGLLQPAEAIFMIRIYGKMEGFSAYSSINVCEIVCMWLLFSLDVDTRSKFKLLFDVFDSDFDGCLQWDQLLEIFCCLCRLRPLAEELSLVCADQSFQHDLASQEGLRYYEKVRWNLQRGSGCKKVEIDILSFRELWSVVGQQEDVLRTLMPISVDFYKLALEATSWELGEQEALPAAAAQAAHKHGEAASQAHRSSHSRLSTRPSALSPPGRAPAQGIGGIGSRPETSPSPSFRPGRAEATEMAPWNKRGQRGLTILELEEDWPHSPAAHYGEMRKHTFQQSLRKSGTERLTQMTRGFMLATGQLDAEETEPLTPRSIMSYSTYEMASPMAQGQSPFSTFHGGFLGTGSPTVLQMPGTPSPVVASHSRPSTSLPRRAAASASASSLTRRPRPASLATAGGGGRSESSAFGLASPDSSIGFSGFAPVGSPSQAVRRNASTPSMSATSPRTLTMSRDGERAGSYAMTMTGSGGRPAYWDGVPGVMQTLYSQKLGAEALDRFRLVAAVRGPRGSQLGPSKDDFKGAHYKCQLCHGVHVLSAGCGGGGADRSRA